MATTIQNSTSNKTTFTSFEHEEVNGIMANGDPYTKHFLIFNRENAPDVMNILSTLIYTDDFYNNRAKVPIDSFFPILDTLKNKVEGGEYSLVDLTVFLSDHFKDKIESFEKMAKDGKINFENLRSIFKIGTKFYTEKHEELVGSIVHETSIEQGCFGEKYFVIKGLLTYTDGKDYFQFVDRFAIEEFKGLRNVDSLSIKIMNDDIEKQLIERGKKFLKYGLNRHYQLYKGTMFRRTQCGNYHFKADGRVMVDVNGFIQMNPNYPINRNNTGYNQGKTFKDIPEDLLYMTYPFLLGFSFSSKQWGEIYVENLDEIKFDDKAFDYLVLDENIKQMSKALVTNVSYGFTDIISGKSGGCIFLLHGPPGVGKTLTCEAIAELLHKPLYSITVGELGTDPKQLEKHLTQILEIANSWDSVILIDEADIFMEKRSIDDVNRNAMVSIFLRLLERHQGVLFLTTNRVENIDEAFRSRVSIIIEYSHLNKESREKIWKNLLGVAEINLEPGEINELSEKYNFNGRQIKNIIRMAQCLAKDQNKRVTLNLISSVSKFM